MPINFGRFVLNRVVADREGLDAATSNRVALTGTLIGGASPVLSVVLTQQLAEREKPAPPAPTADKPAPVETVAVPEVIGINVEQAKEKLIGSGVTTSDEIEIIKEVPKPDGEVLEQEPLAGTPVPKGSTISVTLTTSDRSSARRGGRP